MELDFFIPKIVVVIIAAKKNEGKPNEANYHNLMAGYIVHPNQKKVIPFAPEAIVKHDGKTKNDCVKNAKCPEKLP